MNSHFHPKMLLMRFNWNAIKITHAQFTNNGRIYLSMDNGISTNQKPQFTP